MKERELSKALESDGGRMNTESVWQGNMTENDAMNCRPGCGACCIAPSISSPIPGMPAGKPAGERCVQLTADNRCRLFGSLTRPAICAGFAATREICGAERAEALERLEWLERQTRSRCKGEGH